MPYEATPGMRPRQNVASALQGFLVKGHVAHKVLPPMGTAAEDFTIAKINNAECMRIVKTRRAPNMPAGRSMTPVTTTNGHCEERTHEEPVDRTLKKRYASFFDAEKIAAQSVCGIIATDLENDVASTLFNTTNYSIAAASTQGLDTANRWTDRNLATPIDDIAAIKRLGRIRGTPLNAMVINEERADTLWNTNQIRAMLTQNYGRTIPAEADAAVLASILKLDEVIIAGAQKNTANPGAAGVFDYVWDSKYCGLFRKSTDMTMRDPRLGHMFVYTNPFAENIGEEGPPPDEMPESIMEFARVESYGEPNVRSTVIACTVFTDELLLDSDAFKLIKIAD